MIITVDVETGGFNAMQIDDDPPSALLSIGAVAYDIENDMVVDWFEAFIKPEGLKVEEQALKANGLHDYLMHEDSELSALQKFDVWLDNLPSEESRFVPMGHNIPFDLSFIEEASFRTGVPLSKIKNHRRIETYTCAAMLPIASGSLSLASALNYLVKQDDFLKHSVNDRDCDTYTCIITDAVDGDLDNHNALSDACYSLALFRYINGKVRVRKT